MHVKGGQEIYPDDVAGIVFLCRQNISEVVPVEEPLTSEHVQDIKDGGAILLHLMNGGRGGRSWGRERRGCQFQPLGRWSGRGGQRHLQGLLGLTMGKTKRVWIETLGMKLLLERSHRGHGGKRSRRDVTCMPPI